LKNKYKKCSKPIYIYVECDIIELSKQTTTPLDRRK